MNYIAEFLKERDVRIDSYADNQKLQNVTKQFSEATLAEKYSYNFSWLGRPIIQYPQDIMALQEIIWEVKPDLIIETGIAHGFQSLENNVEMLYLHTEFYNKESEGAIRYNDPKINIQWPIPITEVSEKDKNHPLI